MDDRITALYRQCDPSESLQPGDARYVNVDRARGEDVILKYASSIAMAGRPKVKFFAGHLGIGKTSELFRLRRLLEDQAFTVVYIDASSALDVNDLDFPDLLALIADQTLGQLRDAKVPGFGRAPQLLGRIADEFVGVLGSRVMLKGVGVTTSFGTAALELRNNPSKRRAIRDAIEAVGTQLLDAINDMLSDAVTTIRNQGRNGLVLIVDGLDKVHRRPVDKDGAVTTHDRLFIDRSTQLASLEAHCVYTVPISLLYSPRQALLQEAFGTFDPPLPMIALRGAGKGPVTGQTPGMRAMAEMIDRRCAEAKLAPAEAFEPAAVDLLGRSSGGHPRHLMMLVRGACDQTDRLPITEADARQSVRQYANSLFRQLPNVPDYLAKLKMFDGPQPDYPRDDVHWQMLYLLHLFEYMNGEPYFEVNPVFRQLASYADATPVA